MFFRFLFGGFLTLTLISLLGKATLLLWSPYSFDSLTLTDQLWALLWGIRFDLAAAALLWLPVTLLSYLMLRLGWRHHLSLRTLWAPAMLLLGMQLADLLYFDNSGRHVGYEIKELLPEFASLATTALTSYSLPTFSFLLLLGASGYYSRHRWPANTRPAWRQLDVPLLLWLAIGVVAVRGSLTDMPMKPDRAYAIGNNQQAVLAMAPAYSMLSSLMEKQQAKQLYLQAPAPQPARLTEQLADYLTSHQGSYHSPVKPLNVILFMLESWPAELMRSYNPIAPRVTPELDKLRTRGITTDGLIAGGRRTVEGFYSALCSQPNPLGGGIPNTFLQSYSYRCLPAMLRDAGWEVAVFQGMHKGATGQFSQQLGVTSSYGKQEMPPATVEQNSWGYQDPDLYRFVLHKAQQEQKPFFYIVNNATTHDDKLPAGEPWVFGKADKAARQMSVMHYADRALGDFIREYEKSGIEHNTLLIFTADHTSGDRSGNMGRYWIPFSLFDTAGTIATQYKSGIGSQMDIAPTILDALGGRAPWFAGQSLLSHQPTGGSYFTEGTLGWVTTNQVVEHSLRDPAEHRCFNWRRDLPLARPEPCDVEAQGHIDFNQSFTWYAQALLFGGKTDSLGQPLATVLATNHQ